MTTSFPVPNYGGWAHNRPAATGQPIGTTAFVGLLLLGGSLIHGGGTGDTLSPKQFRLTYTETKPASIAGEFNRSYRTPQEDLHQIRGVLKPAVSDLAISLGVSRQSIYNWLNGEVVAEENVAKLRDLALAADMLVEQGFAGDSSILRRKFSHDRTLLQLVRDGESATSAMQALIQVLQREAQKKAEIKAMLANRSPRNANPAHDLIAPNDVG